eukprot:692676-Prymnesium_polylepis.1
MVGCIGTTAREGKSRLLLHRLYRTRLVREPWLVERSHRARVESERKEAKAEKRRARAAISE